ncbi:MAG: hypothetical protein V1913_06595 [Fibrobacterota bacterium]
MKKINRTSKYPQIAARISPEEKERVESFAEKNKVTVGWVIKRGIEMVMERKISIKA